MNSKLVKIVIFSIFIAYGFLLFVYILKNNITITHDDAFISYVYAKNFADGHGLVFNKNEKVWGYTSPAQTILLGLLSLLSSNTLEISILIGFLFISLNGFLIYLISLEFFGAFLSLLVSFMTVGYYSYEFLGLETNFLIFTQLLFLLLISKNKIKMACLIGSLSCLVRPDSLVFVTMILLVERKKLTPKMLMYFIIPGLLWLTFTKFAASEFSVGTPKL